MGSGHNSDSTSGSFKFSHPRSHDADQIPYGIAAGWALPITDLFMITDCDPHILFLISANLVTVSETRTVKQQQIKFGFQFYFILSFF